MESSVSAPLRPVTVGLVAFALSCVGGCEIHEPEIPTFTTTVTLPLGDETVTLADLVADEDYLVMDPEGTVGFTIAGEPDSLALGFDLAVDLPAAQEGTELGDFTLVLAPLAFAFTLGELYPPAAEASGVPMIVPPFAFAAASEPSALGDVAWAVLAGGTLHVTLENGLPVTVSGPAAPEATVLELIDPQSGAPIVTLPVPAIPAQGSTELVADLAATTLGDAVVVRLTGGSPGSLGEVVTVDGTASLTLTVSFADLAVAEALAVIGPQTFTGGITIDLPEGYAVGEAILESGAGEVVVTNELPLPCTADLVWPHLRDERGEPLQVSLDLAPGASISRTLDFADLTVQAPPGEFLGALDATIAGRSPGSAGELLELNADQRLAVALAPGCLTFRDFQGIVPTVEVPLDPVVESIDLPDELTGIELTAAALTVTLSTSTEVPLAAELTLTGRSASGVARDLTVQAALESGADARAADAATFVFDEHNSDLLPFLNNLPVEVSAVGVVRAGGADGPGTVHGDDYVRVAWVIDAPAEFVLRGAVIKTDPQALALDADLRETIRDHAGAARLEAIAASHFPVGATLRVLADTSGFAAEPLLVLGPVAVAGGVLDAESRVCVAPRESRPIITLSADEARLFGLDNLSTRLEITLPDTAGEPVRLSGDDYLTVRGFVRCEVLVDDNW